jgi:hypothetical protein
LRQRLEEVIQRQKLGYLIQVCNVNVTFGNLLN